MSLPNWNSRVLVFHLYKNSISILHGRALSESDWTEFSSAEVIIATFSFFRIRIVKMKLPAQASKDIPLTSFISSHLPPASTLLKLLYWRTIWWRCKNEQNVKKEFTNVQTISLTSRGLKDSKDSEKKKNWTAFVRP